LALRSPRRLPPLDPTNPRAFAGGLLWRRRFFLSAFCIGWAVAPLPGAWAAPRAATAEQPQPGVVLEGNEQIYCVLAALNAAGYDAGLGVDTGNSTRREVRALLARKSIVVLPGLQRFYSEHRVANNPGADLGQYISLALLLGSPPDFKFTVPQADLPPDAKDVAGLILLLKSFYNQANLLDSWAQAQGRYQAEVERYSDPVRRRISLADAYLRFPSGAYLGRTYAIYLDLLGEPGQIQARIYGQNYYLVVTPSKEPKLEEIRHQYLHFRLDPLAAKYAPEIHQKIELQAIARGAPSLARDFKEDFPLLVTECLIRAAELRMDKSPKAQAEKTLEELTAGGLILARYFYEALATYGEQDTSLSVFYKPMVLAIKPREERQRLANVKFSPPPQPAPDASAQGLSEEERLLNQGDNYIAQGKYSEAKAVFQSALEKFGPKSERALYGLAVVAANTRKPDLAEEYFLKTLEAARDLRIATWSHIYLGRLYDLKGNRQQALGQYRVASLTAAAFPEALRAVEGGMQQPFGSKPKE